MGRRVAVARDTLEKAAGAMAHYGNNALNVMRNQAEYCGELVEDIDANLTRALRISARADGRISLGFARPPPGPGAGKHPGPRGPHGTGRASGRACWRARGA